MAITLDRQVVFAGNDGGVGDDPTVFTTTGSIASAGFLIAMIGSNLVPTTVTAGGNSMAKDRQHLNTDNLSVWSVYLAGGLATSSSLSLDFATAPNYVICVATSFLGVKTASALDQVNSRSGSPDTGAWTSSSVTPTEAGTLVCGFADSSGGSDSRSTPGGSFVEAHDASQLDNVVFQYVVVAGTTATNPGGTWATSQAGTTQRYITVNYKTASSSTTISPQSLYSAG